jgi:acyl dehydratase
MTVIPDKLLSFPIPEVRQKVTPHAAAFYALSVGLGQDPLDPNQLEFTNPSLGMRVMPSMALVLGYPGFWIGDADTGIDAARVLHREQRVEIFQRIPIPGEIISRTVVTDLIDRGQGKGSLLYSKRSISDAFTGVPLARIEQAHLLKGDDGFGSSSDRPASSRVEYDGDPWKTVDMVTRPEQALYYRLNGDMNPLHSNPEFAASAGFNRPILHGMCTFGFACHAVLKEILNYDSTRLKVLSMNFSSPVFPGDTLRTEFWRNGTFRMLATERNKVVITDGKYETF